MPAQEKTEKATPKKREDTRKKGQVLKSAEINTAVMVLSLFAIIFVMSGTITRNMREFLTVSLTTTVLDGVGDMDAARIHHLVIDGFGWILRIAWPILAVAVIAGIAVNLAQVGFLFSTESIKPQFNRISPLQGLKRIFSMRSVVELLKSLFKIGVVSLIVYLEYMSDMEVFENIIALSISDAAGKIFSMCMAVGLKACLALVAMGLADYAYQWWEFEKNIKMTKQEVKDEYKMIEGDPKIKQAIKQKQREMSQRRMMAAIPKADVVITNPTHYAVALEYKDSEMDAPVVLAKGKDLVAQNIKRKAAEYGIPMVENKPIAQALYMSVDVGSAIPEELFAAVAEILAYVYQTKENAGAARSTA
ncbi:MAG: flagellar biosynthesis protein FlhB [Oscillospiraceae bacterium]|nr:flagellar biosynthesis protein FlhB [Oscillospiraceae bacterium]